MSKKDKINAYIVDHMIHHALVCSESWCVCKASTFQDALADLRKVDKKHKIDIEEIFNNETS